jgi:hypothetical protein
MKFGQIFKTGRVRKLFHIAYTVDIYVFTSGNGEQVFKRFNIERACFVGRQAASYGLRAGWFKVLRAP